jgi:hypothetical protein
MSPKRQLSVAKGGKLKKARKDSTSSTPPTRHSRRQAGEAPETTAQPMVDTPRRKTTSPNKTKNTTQASAAILTLGPNQQTQSVPAPDPAAVDIATSTSESELPAQSTAITTPAAAIGANSTGLNEVAQSAHGSPQGSIIDTTSEAADIHPPQQSNAIEPTPTEPTGNKSDANPQPENITSPGIPNPIPQPAPELPINLFGSQKAPESIRDTVHGAGSEAQPAIEPAEASQSDSVPSLDLTLASHELLQQAAEHPTLQESSAQAPVTQEFINAADGPPSNDTAERHPERDTNIPSLEAGDVTVEVPKAESAEIDPSPEFDITPSSDSLREPEHKIPLPEPAAVQAHNDSQETPNISEDADTWGLTDDFDQELFGEDLPLPDSTDGIFEPESPRGASPMIAP